jgi:hypothetical protein
VITQVYELIGASEDYPRLNPRHPRNRGVDWEELGRYLRGESPADADVHRLFVKVDRPFDAFHIPITGWIVSQRLSEVFEQVVADDVGFTPLVVNEQRYWGVRVDRLLADALDLERSDLHFDVSGSVRSIDVPVWRASELTDPSMFRIPHKRYTVWATEAVSTAYAASGCTGITFWPRGSVVE